MAVEKFKKSIKVFRVLDEAGQERTILSFTQENPYTIIILSTAGGGWSPQSNDFQAIDPAIEYFKGVAEKLDYSMLELVGSPDCPDCHGLGYFMDSTTAWMFKRVCALCRDWQIEDSIRVLKELQDEVIIG